MKKKISMERLSLQIFTLILTFFILTQALAQETPILTIEPGGHTAMVKELIFTPDGKSLISAGDDKVVRIWDVETGELKSALRGQIGDGNEGKIFAAALNPDGETVAVGGYFSDDSIRLFNRNTGALTTILQGHTNVILDLAFSPDGKWLASGSSDKTVRLWGVGGLSPDPTGTVRLAPTHTLAGHTDRVYGVAFSPDAARAASASDDDTLRLWDVSDGKLLRKMTGHKNDVNALAYSPDGKHIASGSYDHTIRLWNGKTGRFVKVLGKHGGSVNTVSFSPDSRRLVSVGSGKNYTAHVWRIPSGKLLTTFEKHNNTVIASAFSPDGKTIATAGGDNYDIYLWDAQTGAVKTHIVGNGRSVFSAAFSQNENTFAFGNTDAGGFNGSDPLEHQFDLVSMTLLGDISAESEQTAGSWRRAVTKHDGLTLKREDRRTLGIQQNGRIQATITLTQAYDAIRCYTFTPSGEILVGSGYTLASYGRSGEVKQNFIGHTGEIWSVSVSPDGRLLVSGSSDQTVRLWNIETGELLTSFFIGIDREWVAWTPVGYYKASAGGDRLIGWHVNRGEAQSAEYYYAYQYREKFYCPDVLEQILKEGSVENAVASAKTANVTIVRDLRITQIPHKKTPKIQIISPSQDTTSQQSEARIIAQVTPIEKLTNLTISVNGRPMWKVRGEIAVKSAMKGDLIDRTVPLVPGENIISVIAKNENGVSQPASLSITYGEAQARKATMKPDLYLLSIGVSTYAVPQYNLRYADKDAQSIANVFKEQEGKLFASVNTKVLLNDNAQKGAILDGLEWLLKETTQKDMVVVFVSGHGMHDARRNYYFLPYNVDPKHLRRTGVNWYEFQDTLSSLPSKALLLVDTCHSGGVTGRTKGIRDLDITSIVADLANDESGVVVMASSTGREVSIESNKWGHGAFTLALTEGLSGKADYNRDSTVYLTEIDNYVTDRVKELTHGEQHPTTQKPTTVRSFPVVVLQSRIDD